MPIEYAASRPLAALTLRSDAVGTVLPGVLLVGCVASADGGYSTEKWAWLAALTFVPAAVVLVERGGAWLGWLLGLLLAFGCWTLL